MATVIDAALREQLIERRVRLETAAADDSGDAQIRHLLEEVDAALARIEDATYGICQVCQDPVEAERIMTDPLVCVCLECLSVAQRRALEEDLELAANIQAGLLPPLGLLRRDAQARRPHSHGSPSKLNSSVSGSPVRRENELTGMDRIDRI